jgi:hypothetical protein
LNLFTEPNAIGLRFSPLGNNFLIGLTILIDADAEYDEPLNIDIFGSFLLLLLLGLVPAKTLLFFGFGFSVFIINFTVFALLDAVEAATLL